VRHGAGPGGVFAGYGRAYVREQLSCLAEAYDPFSIERLAGTGVTDGWHCLEVGAGAGSIATWLARRVAPSGSVLATDLDPADVPAAQGLAVRRHDITTDPLPAATFDLIHARLVLMLLPQRHAVLGRLVRALKPGGWLQLDEFDITYGPALLAPDRHGREAYHAFLAAKIAAMRSAGVDPAWGRNAPSAMCDAGLVSLDAVPRLYPWRAGSPGLRLLVNHTHQLRDALLAAGLTSEQLADARRVMTDPAFQATSCAIYSVQGRRPC
jgi:SAM-dependent methyltransferase